MKNLIRVIDPNDCEELEPFLESFADDEYDYRSDSFRLLTIRLPDVSYIAVDDLEFSYPDAYVRVHLYDEKKELIFSLSLTDVDDVVEYDKNDDGTRLIKYQDDLSIQDARQYKQLEDFLFDRYPMEMVITSDETVFHYLEK